MSISSCHIPRLKVLESDVSSLGFSNSWRLTKEKKIPSIINERPEIHDGDFVKVLLDNTKQPLCQNVDVIATDRQRTQNQQQNFEKFLKIIGSPCIDDEDENVNNSKGADAPNHSFVEDESQRAFQIQQFITTEVTYVEKLRTLVNVIAQPLKIRAQEKDKTTPLNTFLCSKIFINIDEIAEANEYFLADLQDYLKGEINTTFGDICATHAAKFDCYRKYLLGKTEAQQFQYKEFKSNQAYRSFLVKAIEHPQYKGCHSPLPELLIEPVQRIGRYTMMLKDVLRYTPVTHPDFYGLTKALSKLSEIAMMTDDDPTKLANMFHTLLKSIKDTPDSIMKQGRSLVAHLDAVEIHRVSNKTLRPVTIFLFTDLIMVAARPSYGCKAIDLCAIDPDPKAFPDVHGSFISRGMRKEQSLKFKGWADIEQVEIFEGARDRPGSFLLRASSAQRQVPNPESTTSSWETYFQKSSRLFSIVPSKDSYVKPEDMQQHLERGVEFIAAFRKTQALAKQYDDSDKTYHRCWDGLDVYSNIYTPTSYLQAKYKNNFVIVYVEEDENINIKLLLKNAAASPWIVALVQADTGGFRLSICSKVQLGLARDRSRSISENSATKLSQTLDSKTVDFECVFWNNVIICERHLRSSTHFSYIYNKATEEELQKRSRSRSRSLSLSRSTSIPTLGKLFGTSGRSRSRSSSPTRSSRVAPTPSRSSPTTQNNGTSSSNELGSLKDTTYKRGEKHRRPRSKSMMGEAVTPSLAPRETSTKSSATYRSTHISTDAQQSQRFSGRRFSQDSLSQYDDLNLLSSSRHRRSSSALKIVLPDIDPYGIVSRQDTTPALVRRQESSSFDRRSSPESYWDPNTITNGRRSSQSHEAVFGSLQMRYSNESQNSPIHLSSVPSLSRNQGTRSDNGIVPSGSALGLQDPHSRPSSRSSTTSSTASLALNQFGSYGCSASSRSSLSNTMSSFTSQSTRSSVSLEDMELSKVPTSFSPSLRLSMPSEHTDDDDLLIRIHEQLSSQKKSNYGEKLIPRHHVNDKVDQPMYGSTELLSTTNQPLDHVAEIIDSLGKDVGSRWHQLMDKCKLLDMHMDRLTARLQLESEFNTINNLHRGVREETFSLYNMLTTELDEINSVVDSYRNAQSRSSSTSSSPSNDHEMQIKRKLNEAQIEKDYWQRRASELSSQLAEYNRR